MSDRMNRNKLTVPEFPMETFLQVKQEMFDANLVLHREKAAWARVRNSLEKATRHSLDEQFKVEFEKLGTYFLNSSAPELEQIHHTLQELVEEGASAGSLGNHELGSYNLAML